MKMMRELMIDVTDSAANLSGAEPTRRSDALCGKRFGAARPWRVKNPSRVAQGSRHAP
jgi:hypothetical protein